MLHSKFFFGDEGLSIRLLDGVPDGTYLVRRMVYRKVERVAVRYASVIRTCTRTPVAGVQVLETSTVRLQVPVVLHYYFRIETLA
jgi:hypothetical protein